MATHDYVIDNQSASSFRSDLNNVLQAIVSQNSSATAPTTTYANMIWYDTAANQLKKRNEANSGWITLGTIDEGTGTFTPSGERALASQAQAEAGTDNTTVMTPLRSAQAIAALAGSIDYQVFTASGTWTKPSGISADAIVIVEAWGGGGGGSRNSGSCGGGGGGYATKYFLASDLGATVSVTVGAGGAGATVSGNDGVAGGNSSFGSVITAYGGGGGGDNASPKYGGQGGGHNKVGATDGIDSTNFGGGKPGGVDGSGNPIEAVFGDMYGGGGGSGGGNASTATLFAVYGGGGGGGANASSSAGGVSKYGGNGGTGNTTTGGAGSAPGGGGGAGTTTGGAGGRGEVRVWTIG